MREYLLSLETDQTEAKLLLEDSSPSAELNISSGGAVDIMEGGQKAFVIFTSVLIVFGLCLCAQCSAANAKKSRLQLNQWTNARN